MSEFTGKTLLITGAGVRAYDDGIDVGLRIAF
jgi:hypothetical protein